MNTDYVTLVVTEAVVKQVEAGNGFQRQIAIRDASPVLRSLLDKANSDNPVIIPVGKAFGLLARDTHAIWLKHQTGPQADDFMALFDLLRRHPGIPLKISHT